MLDFAEIRRSLQGAWRLFCGDPNGVQAFDLSSDGFLRSFAVIFLVAPVYFATIIAERGLLLSERVLLEDLSDTRFFLIRSLSFIVDWFAFPVLMVVISRQLSLTSRYAIFITVRNWAALPATLLTSIPTISYGLGLIPVQVSSFATFVFLIIALRYGWFIAKTTLATTSMIAVGILALDLALSLVIGRFADLLIGV